MSGRDGSRGYLYQGIASVIKALMAVDWDKIYVEYPTEGDKVDIGLEKDSKLMTSIQVKSSVNLFTRANLKNWLGELAYDSTSACYELFLIGNCDNSANDICKKLRQFHESGMKDLDALNAIDPAYLNARRTHIIVVPYELEHLKKIAISNLHEYMGSRDIQPLPYACLDFILLDMISNHLGMSTTQGGCSRREFDERLQGRIQLLKNEYVKKRTNIGIRSYSRGSETMEADCACLLSLLNRFESRFLHDGQDWDRDIFPTIERFLIDNTDQRNAYALVLNTHPAIAFAAGKVLDTISGVDVVPRQKTLTGIVLWEVDPFSEMEYQDWLVEFFTIDNKYDGVALVISPTRDIKDDVLEYIKCEKLHIGKLINCKFERATNHSIVDGTHCARLANSLFEIINKRTIKERKEMLHIFPSAPNALMFYLGQNSRGFGKCTLYDYDFQLQRGCTYYPTMTFI